MSNVVYLNAFREVKDAEIEDQAYSNYILGLDKLELLEEMVNFQIERSAKGRLDVSMMVRGRYLFKALEQTAETQELRILCRSYRRHLEYELQEHREKSAT